MAHGSEVWLSARYIKTTCHVDVTLDDGHVVSMDLAMTQQAVMECCSVRTTMYLAAGSILAIKAPNGYVPRLDAGVDGSLDGAGD